MFSGSFVALTTPFTASNLIDEQALQRQVEWHIEAGTHGLVPVGTTGESPTLTEVEHRRVIEIVVEQAAGRLPVIAGAGSNNPQEAIVYSQHAAQVGATATLHVAGYYNRPRQEGLYQHFRAVHDATTLPIIIYNIPPRAIVDILPDTMARLAELPRIVGVKDATADLSRPGLEAMRIQGAFCYLSGEDATAVAYNAAGGNGCISVTANIAPKACSLMQAACLAGDYPTAMQIQKKLMPLHEALFCEPSPAGAKFAGQLLGLCDERCRLPVLPLSSQSKAAIERSLADIQTAF